MVQINFAQKEIQCKIVYYGPGMSGKTTNLELVHGKVPAGSRGELTSIATTGERTLYFDYMPLELGQIAGIQTKFQLYTVPGQIYYKATRRLVLQGVDGIVFVADSSASKLKENKESLQDLEDNLKEMSKSLKDIPIIMQYNKRDLPDAMSIEDLQRQVNVHDFPHVEAVASTGEGVFPTLKILAGKVLEKVNQSGLAGARPRPAAAAVAATRKIATPAATAREPALAGAAAAQSHGGMTISSPLSPTEMPPPPAPQPSHGPMPPGPRTGTPPAENNANPTPAPWQRRDMEERVVAVSGLGREGHSPRTLAVVALVAVIATAAWWVLSRF